MQRYRASNQANIMRLIMFICAVMFVGIVLITMYFKNTGINKIVYKSDTVSEEFNGYKIAQIDSIKDTEINILSILNREDPDIVVITGIISQDQPSNKLIEQLQEISNTYKTYYVKYGEDDVDYTQYGLIDMSNVRTEINSNSGENTIQLIGMGFQQEKDIKYNVNSIIDLSDKYFNILIMNKSAMYNKVSNLGLDIVLAGEAQDKEISKSEKGSTMFIGQGISKTDNKDKSSINVITLDNSVEKNKNLLERLLDMIVKDVGTKFDGQEIKEHTYEYSYGEEKK